MATWPYWTWALSIRVDKGTKVNWFWTCSTHFTCLNQFWVPVNTAILAGTLNCALDSIHILSLYTSCSTCHTLEKLNVPVSYIKSNHWLIPSIWHIRTFWNLIHPEKNQMDPEMNPTSEYSKIMRWCIASVSFLCSYCCCFTRSLLY